jgi:hypothetical protein
MNLCEQASSEQDPEKMLELVTEINRLLDEKDQRLADLRVVKRTELARKNHPHAAR